MGNCQGKEVNISKTLFYYTLLLVNLCIPGGGGGISHPVVLSLLSAKLAGPNLSKKGSSGQ